jgi:hypothetical protein
MRFDGDPNEQHSDVVGSQLRSLATAKQNLEPPDPRRALKKLTLSWLSASRTGTGAARAAAAGDCFMVVCVGGGRACSGGKGGGGGKEGERGGEGRLF